MFYLDQFPVAAFVGTAAQEQPLFFGAVGLALGASVGGGVELLMLRRVLARRRGLALPWRAAAAMLGAAALAALPAAGLWWLLPAWPAVFVALLVVGGYGVSYLALARLFGFDELQVWAGRIFKRGKGE